MKRCPACGHRADVHIDHPGDLTPGTCAACERERRGPFQCQLSRRDIP